MSSTQDRLIETLNKRLWEAQRSVREKREKIQALRDESRGDLQQQIQEKSKELTRLRDERNQAEEVTNAWERVAQNAAKEVRERTLTKKRLEAKSADVKRLHEKLAADTHTINALLESALSQMDACKPGQTNSPGSAGNSRLSRGAIADYRHLEAELQEAHKQKAESIDKMFHLAKEKEVQNMIEQKAQVEAKLEAKGVEAERAIEMSEREVRVYCSQRSLAAIHERLDEQKTLVEEAKQRKAAEKIATAESHRPEAQESLPGHLQQATERSDYHRRSDATNTDLTYLEGYDMPPPTGESYHNRRRHSTELQERGRTERVESDVDHDWRSNESARIDNEISDYHSRGAHQSGSIDRLHASRRHPSNTSRETCQNEYRDQRDRCTTYKEYRFRDYILHPDDLLSEHSASGRSPEDWRDFLTHTSSRPGSPVEKDRESPLSVARVDLGELEPSNIFGNSRNLDQGLSAEDHNRLF